TELPRTAQRSGAVPRQATPSAGAASRLDVGSEGTEVELDHLGVLGQFPAGAGVGVPPLVEHVAAVADLQAPAGALLDHHHADPGPVDHPGAQERLVLTDRRETG